MVKLVPQLAKLESQLSKLEPKLAKKSRAIVDKSKEAVMIVSGAKVGVDMITSIASKPEMGVAVQKSEYGRVDSSFQIAGWFSQDIVSKNDQ